MDESAESDEDEGRASMRAWRFVPEPEMRTTRRRGSVDDVGSSVSEDMMTDKNEMVVNLMWRELQEGRLILKIICDRLQFRILSRATPPGAHNRVWRTTIRRESGTRVSFLPSFLHIQIATPPSLNAV